ncbi:hypothetical protein HNW13_022260 [Shewanella sp. BF02_Schw]|nr:hypothetical protein [Shewanella sp. BF02_Schw]
MYGILSRARVRFCVTSPKRLLSGSIGSRSAISSVNFPSRLNDFSSMNSFNLPSPIDLIYGHTLFPLYSPFLPENRRLECLSHLQFKSFGSVHLASGYAASLIPKLHVMRSCRDCIEEQLNTVGEPYWRRIHQIVGINHCCIHGTPLVNIQPYHSMQHRHEYFPLQAQQIETLSPQISVTNPKWLDVQVCWLLNRGEQQSLSFEQWTNLYRDLLVKNGFAKGCYCNYPLLKEAIESVWSEEWLRSMNLFPNETESDWLHKITRKHRKSFSYLEHLVALYAIQKDIKLSEVIDRGKSLVKSNIKKVKLTTFSKTKMRENQKIWLNQVKQFGAKVARKNGNESTYMWLYRHNRDWLLNTNNKYKRPIPVVNNRVDWKSRDMEIVRAFIRIINKHSDDVSGPRLSIKWLVSQLDTGTSVEKYLYKLPLASIYLARYSESITDYQIRRITQVMIMTRPNILPRWQILRLSGLSDERMTQMTCEFLDSLLTNFWALRGQ